MVESETTPKSKFKFQILRGTHNHKGKTYYGRNKDVFEIETDLRRFNVANAPRFRLVDENNPPLETAKTSNTNPTELGEEYSKEELEQLSVKDLKQLAEEEEIDLGSASRKDEIIKVLLGD